MPKKTQSFVVLENTTTLQRYRLVANLSGKRLPQGSYKVVELSRNPNLYHLDGLFAVTQHNEAIFVDKTGLQHYAPFNITEPQWVVVSSKPPDGDPPITVSLHKNAKQTKYPL